MRKVVLYLRSSKDQKDVSIQTQRHELKALAQARGLQIVGEYSDVVESAKEWDRPGFQELIKAIRLPGKPWDAILTKDTSRVARTRLLAMIFEEGECAPNDVEVIYSNIPEGGDKATTMLLRTILQAMDEWHSITSREKGLAGMAENVRQGFRAGGNAPRGYRLRPVEIGIVRDGAPVTKSKLEPNEDAGSVQSFLELRAAGVARTAAARQAGLADMERSSLVSLEWNALTYAGCTTFGVYEERTKRGGAYKAKRKRRPRSQWTIQPDTHPGLITRQQAEKILEALECSAHGKAVSAGKLGASQYALSGLLQTPAGGAWCVNKRTHYFAPRQDKTQRYVPIAVLDRQVIDQVLGMVKGEGLARELLAQTRASLNDHSDEIKQLQREIVGLSGKVDKAVDMALGAQDPAPFQRKVDALEAQRRQLVARQASLQQQQALQAATADLELGEIQEVMELLAERLTRAQPAEAKAALRGLVRRVVLDPDTLTGEIEYQVAMGNGDLNPVSLALLPGFEPGFKP